MQILIPSLASVLLHYSHNYSFNSVFQVQNRYRNKNLQTRAYILKSWLRRTCPCYAWKWKESWGEHMRSSQPGWATGAADMQQLLYENVTRCLGIKNQVSLSKQPKLSFPERHQSSHSRLKLAEQFTLSAHRCCISYRRMVRPHGHFSEHGHGAAGHEDLSTVTARFPQGHAGWRRGLGQGGEAPIQRTGRGRGRSRGAECVHDYMCRCLHVLMHVCTQEHSLWNLALTLPSTTPTTVWILCEKAVWFETVYLQNMQKLLCFGSATSLIKAAAAAAAKSLQSCPTLCDPIDGSPPGSAVPEILHARTLEWVAISFSNAWKWSHSVMSNSWQPHGL